jgi:hypothetical protein
VSLLKTWLKHRHRRFIGMQHRALQKPSFHQLAQRLER